MLREVVPELLAENEKLWLLVQRMLRHRYGPRSEKLDLDQLQLGLEDAEQMMPNARWRKKSRHQCQSAGVLHRPIAIVALCRRTCHATRSSSISRARTAPAVVAGSVSDHARRVPVRRCNGYDPRR